MAPTTGKAYDRRWWTLVVLSVSLLVISLDNTILNVALPTIERDLDASAGDLQWIVDSYTLVFAGLLLTMGSLGDRFGRRRALVAGLVVFGAGSLLSALATSADMLIASRALMGIGGALIMPSTLSVLTNVFPAEERPKAIGIWAAVAGPRHRDRPGGRRLADRALRLERRVPRQPPDRGGRAGRGARRSCPSRATRRSRGSTRVGAVLSTAGLGVLTWAIIEAGGERGWTDGVDARRLRRGAALRWRRSWPGSCAPRSPMLDVRLFRVRRFSGASVSIALVFFSLFGAIFFLTMYLQEVMDYGALEAGLRVTPVALGLVLGGPLSAKLAARIGTRNVVAGGLAVVAARAAPDVRRGRRHRLRPDRRLAGAAGLRHGHDDGPRDRVDHELAAARPRGRRLGHERHGAHGRRHARRGRPREPPVRPLRCRHGGRGRGAAGAGAGERPRARSAAPSAVAERIGGDAGATLERVAETAFSSAMGTSLTVAAGVALAGALVALVVLPGPGARAGREGRPLAEAAPA